MDGTTIEHTVEATRTLTRPLTNTQVAAKFRTLTDGIVDPTQQSAIEELVMNLQRLGDLTQLSRLLAPTVAAAF